MMKDKVAAAPGWGALGEHPRASQPCSGSCSLQLEGGGIPWRAKATVPAEAGPGEARKRRNDLRLGRGTRRREKDGPAGRGAPPGQGTDIRDPLPTTATPPPPLSLHFPSKTV